MIGYQDMEWCDAPNYFGGCAAFEWIASARKVNTYRMHFEGEYGGHELAYDCEVLLLGLGETEDMFATGRELWEGDDFITHRFGIEYVPVSDTELVRISMEPASTRMVKGMCTDFTRYLPVLGDDPTKFTTTTHGDAAILCGIAKVLEIGTPAVMSRRIPRQEAYSRARAAVRTMMEHETRTVCVPEFKWAIIKHRTHKRWAYVIKSGRHVGYLRRATAGTDLCFFGIRSTVADRDTRALINKGLEESARNMLCERVEWVMPGCNPINQSRFNITGG